MPGTTIAIPDEIQQPPPPNSTTRASLDSRGVKAPEAYETRHLEP